MRAYNSWDLYHREGGVPKVFFAYVWGAPGEPAWPLIFSTKAARAHARSVLSEGDLFARSGETSREL